MSFFSCRNGGIELRKILPGMMIVALMTGLTAQAASDIKELSTKKLEGVKYNGKIYQYVIEEEYETDDPDQEITFNADKGWTLKETVYSDPEPVEDQDKDKKEQTRTYKNLIEKDESKVRFPNGISKSMRKQIDDEFEKKEQEYAKRREEARREYQEKVDNGEIIPKTREEITIDHAQGDPFKESTQAARRMLVKKGIMTEEELNRNVQAWDEKWTAQESEKTFAEQVDDVLNGKFPVYSNLKVCNTPQILLKVGCDSLPMLYTQKHLKDAIAPMDSKEHKHGLGIEQIKKLPQLLEKPAIIFDSPVREDSLIAVTTEFDSNDNPVMVSIKLNGQGRYELTNVESNFITSVYGRNNFGAYFQKIIESNNLLFCDKEKSQKIFERWGEQYSELTNTFDFDTILHPSNNIVKWDIENKNNIVEDPVSAKQEKYAQQIAQTLHIDLPQSNTKQAYQDFIREHTKEFCDCFKL